MGIVHKCNKTCCGPTVTSKKLMSEADSDFGTNELLIACDIASTNPQKEGLLLAVSKKKNTVHI